MRSSGNWCVTGRGSFERGIFGWGPVIGTPFTARFSKAHISRSPVVWMRFPGLCRAAPINGRPFRSVTVGHWRLWCRNEP